MSQHIIHIQKTIKKSYELHKVYEERKGGQLHLVGNQPRLKS